MRRVPYRGTPPFTLSAMFKPFARRASLPFLAAMLLVGGLALSGCFSMQAPMPRSSGGSSGGGRTELTLVNRTGVPIYYVYVSSCSSSEWGPDQLGSNVVMPGSTYTWTMDSGCYDLKAVDRDGREAVERRVQVVGAGKRWTLS